MFLVGRLLSGLGVGLIVTLVPIYQSEISPAKSRGKVVGSHGTLIVTGYVCHSSLTSGELNCANKS
jgi:MFS family permease